MTVYSLSHPTRVYPSWASQYVEVGYIRLRWERVGVRGYDLSLGCNPSPDASRRPLPLGEVKLRKPRLRQLADQTRALGIGPEQQQTEQSRRDHDNGVDREARQVTVERHRRALDDAAHDRWCQNSGKGVDRAID